MVREIVQITLMIVLVMVSFFEIKSGFPNAPFWFLYELKYALGRKNWQGNEETKRTMQEYTAALDKGSSRPGVWV